MESNDRKFGSHREEVYIGRLALFLIAIAIVAMAIIELAVALNIEFTRTLVRRAMWIGSSLWVVAAIIGWVDEAKNIHTKKQYSLSSLWFATLLTAIAIGSVVGIYIPTFTTFALWANAVLSVLFLAVIVWVFPQIWRNCAAKQTD